MQANEIDVTLYDRCLSGFNKSELIAELLLVLLFFTLLYKKELNWSETITEELN